MSCNRERERERRLCCWNDTVHSFVTFNFNKRIRAAKFNCKCAFNSTLKTQGFYTQRHIKQLLISCMIMWLSSSGRLRCAGPPSVLFLRTSRTAAVLSFFFFFAFSFSHLTLVAFPLQAIPMCSKLWTKKNNNFYLHSQMYAWPFTYTSIHAYCEDKKSLLYMSGQHRCCSHEFIYVTNCLSWLDCELSRLPRAF